MLLKYGAKNFCCFKDWMEIDLSFNSKVPIEVSQSMPAATAICIKGANASGKTNVLKVLSFISFFCTNSFSQKPENDILIESFFNSSEPSEFFVSFKIDGIEYLYELVLIKKEILSEKIFKKEPKKKLILHREGKKIVTNSIFDESKFNITDRNNASLISVARQFVIAELEPFYSFFKSIITNVSFYGFHKSSWLNMAKISQVYKENAGLFAFSKKYLKEFDTGIVDVSIIEKDSKNKNEIDLYPEFSFFVDGEQKTLGYIQQSRGTQELFDILALYGKVLGDGGILVLDEFDVFLHPDILPHLVKLFTNSKSNPKNAQLIFSTHNTDIIDLMGKYRTVIVEKENGKCFSFRLDEIGDRILRNDRPISPIYKTGRLGGVPKI
jgi:uncharacterized protein